MRDVIWAIGSDGIKEKMLQAKEKFLQMRSENDRIIQEKNNNILKNENRIKQKETTLNQKLEETQRKQNEIAAIKENLNGQLDIITKIVFFMPSPLLFNM